MGCLLIRQTQGKTCLKFAQVDIHYLIKFCSGEEDGRPIHEVRGHSFLVHVRHSASPLAPESPEQNYRGLFNLAGLVLVACSSP